MAGSMFTTKSANTTYHPVDLRDLPTKAREQWDREHVPDKLSPDMIPPWRPLDDWSRRILEKVAERPQSSLALFARDN